MKSNQNHSSKVINFEEEREKRTPKVDPLDYPWEGTLPLSQKMLNAIKEIEDEIELG
jgi:hypothetical protein